MSAQAISQDGLTEYLLDAFGGFISVGDIPYIQHIIQREPFCNFYNASGDATVCPPSMAAVDNKGAVEAALGLQLGAKDSKHAIQQLFPSGLGAEEHLRKALQLQREGFSSRFAVAPLDEDLRYAARGTVQSGVHLRRHRRECMKAIGRLARILQPLTEKLRAHQPPSVRAVAGTSHLALIAVFCYLIKWPDKLLARRFITGFKVVGEMEHSGVFRKQDSVPDFVDKNELLKKHDERLAFWARKQHSGDEEELLNMAVLDSNRSFAEVPTTKAELDQRFGVNGWASCPRL